MRIQRNLLLFYAFVAFLYQIAWSQLKIMPLGDSITQGIINLAAESVHSSQIFAEPATLTHADTTHGLRHDGTRGILGDGNGGYRLVLEQMLNAAGWDLKMVGQRHAGGGNHEGYPGYMSNELLAILPQILAQNNPDVVLLHIGTNDLPWPINADSCYKNTVSMVNTIHNFNPNCIILVAQIIPCLQNTNWAQQRYPSIISLNNKLRQITNNRPYIKLIDMWHAFTNTSNWETQLMCDTWHPNSQGYRVMAEEWRDGLLAKIQGRAPLLTSITPDSGEVTATDFHCTITGNYFLENIQLFLKHDGVNPIEAYQMQYQNENQIQVRFNLTTGLVGQWQVEAINPNKMRSTPTPNVFFNIITPTVFSMSGQVKNQENQPMAGVSVFLSFNSNQYKQKTNTTGFYEFTNLPAGQDYQVSVYLSGYHFQPSRVQFQNLQEDQENIDFTGQQVRLTGYVRKRNGKPISNVTLQLSGANAESTLTKSDGFYEFNHLLPGETFITPKKLDWTFTPSAQTVIIDTSDHEVFFTGVYEPPLYTISGQIINEESGAGIENITVKLVGAETAEILTNPEGFYQFDSLTAAQNYSIQPEDPDYLFQPSDFIIENLNQSQVINFKGIDLRLTRSISGCVLDTLNNPIPNIDIRLVSSQDTLIAVSNQKGEYRFENLQSKLDYIIYPDDPFGHYEPGSIQIVFLKENLTDQNFIRIVKKSPPQIVNLVGQIIFEGEQFKPIHLNEMVIDPDQMVSDLHWSIHHNSSLNFEIDSLNICTIKITDVDWYGRASADFVVQDAEGLSDTLQILFIVKNLNDQPASFHLMADWNVIMDKNGLYHFHWRQAVDPDSDEVHYYIMIDTSATNVMRQPMFHLYARLDTSLITNLNLPQNRYFWTVWAGDLKSPLTRCPDIGTLTVQLITGTAENSSEFVDAFDLRQNYPNPFNPSTAIEYILPEAAPVSLRIYDTRGNLVKELVNRNQPAGQYRIFWNGENQNGNLVASGRYFCEITSINFRKMIQMIFVK
ncbi:carboxypeptidase regulatory-like domain-containing protein [candidate division KSB1 bacterium]|nr:carboxypeptidase regulatory-like domain-containing protein [candidate division KSB1 bacterium]